MKRWLVKTKDGVELKLYYPTLEEVQVKHPNSTIEPYTDMSHMEYINKILSLSIGTKSDYKGRLIHKTPHNAGYILVRVGYDNEDRTYYDFLEYQRHDEATMLSPITWTWSSPQEFCESFLEYEDIDKAAIRLSDRELKKIKPKVKRFYNKDGRAYWVDNTGHTYIAQKSNLPNKYNNEEWDKFHDNPNAVLVSYTTPKDYGTHCKWFESIESFMETYREIVRETPVSFARPTYDIKRTGYTYKHPQDRKNIFRLPYFNIEKEATLIHTLNESSKYNHLARQWAGMCTDRRIFEGKWFEYIDTVEDVVKRYCEWKDSQE